MVGNNGIGQSAINNVGAAGKIGSTTATEAKAGLTALAGVAKAAYSKAPEAGTSIGIAALEGAGVASEHPAVLAA
jgi:hypothetical protein